MVVGYHVIFGAYGFWLPNDPRGSWSDFVGSWELVRFGKATKINSRRSVSGKEHDFALRQAAKTALKYPPVHFNGRQARSIGIGFDLVSAEQGIHFLACSILPEHIHLVVARHCLKIEQIVNLLKGGATRQLMVDGIHPLSSFVFPSQRPPKTFARGQWKVFLNSPIDVGRAVHYVKQNPIKEGLPSQRWTFVEAQRDAAAPLRGRG